MARTSRLVVKSARPIPAALPCVFADKPRTQADVALLGKLCDKLAEIRRQMNEMSWAEENEMNTKNLDVVTEQLVMFEGEYEAVVRAQAQSAVSSTR